jgi:hypothetical protein
MPNFIMGATAMACAIAGLFFLRFWRETGDRLFAIFAVAFWLFGMTRIVLAWLPDSSEHEIYVYLVRLAVFALILLAVLDKNRPRTKAQPIVGE